MMKFIIVLIVILGGLSVVLASPTMKEASRCRLLMALFLSFAGVVVPLGVFFLSTFLGPDSKAGCAHGWLDCFIVCKVALMPVALFATAALYAVEILRVKNRTARWIVMGMVLGAILSLVCLLYGLLCPVPGEPTRLWLLVPFYVAAWYSWRAVQLIRAAPWGVWNCLGALATSLPFWLVSWWWSWSTYKSLPESSPDCFVVTAASYGHEKFVGPFTETIHRGRLRRANQQLITFWRLEAWWHRCAPHSHTGFRRVYNRVGPAIARRVTSPWLADAICAALKPLEWTARLVLKLQSFTNK